MQPSGIGVIRVSGENAIRISEKVFTPFESGKMLSSLKGYTAAYGKVFDKDGAFDDAVALVFKAPHSYTGEDVVEISVHGGKAVMLRTLRALLSAGASSAEAGEFTKRAFLNGKLTLTQAEAVMDVISAQGTLALKAASAAKRGNLYKKITEIKSQLDYADAHLLTYIDFPEEGVQDYDVSEVVELLESAKQSLNELIGRYNSGEVIRSGVDCVIAGKPNVGKSTLMNMLSDSERSIVTDIAGTTRDVVEHTVELDGLVLHLSDTAGLRETADAVEKIGVERAKERIGTAALVLAVFDSSVPLNDDDKDLLKLLDTVEHIIVVNKSDLQSAFDINDLSQHGDCVFISAKNGDGRRELSDLIYKKCGVDNLQDATLLANERQLTAARSASSCIEEALHALQSEVTFDAVSILIDSAIGSLCELTGENVSESVVNEIFSKFCVGK